MCFLSYIIMHLIYCRLYLNGHLYETNSSIKRDTLSWSQLPFLAPCKDRVGFWILDSTSRIPDSKYWIPDSLSVELGFRIPIIVGFRIPKARIPHSTS